MEAPLKQRLIGAIVLAALALIFVPMLLKSPDVRDPDSADVPLEIPDESDSDGIKTIDIPLDGSAPVVSAAKPDTATAQQAAPAPVESLPDAPPTPPSVSEQGALAAAGQFAVVIPAKNDADAKAISAGLVKQGLTTKIQSNGQMFRVRVGPYDTREQAELARLRSTSVVTGGTVVAMDAEARPPSDAALPVKPVTAAPVTAVTAKPVVAAPPAAVKTETKPDAISGAKGFAVQIGAPASEAAAIALRDKARAAGFNSFIQPVDTETGRRYRVRLGPEHTRDEANKLLASVKQKLGGDGIVVAHP
ncbi:MAG TPA: SPOR domain-containing protein [Arenimonas sp.]|nr:SPOR domain-containing protein [Arenimonas sp.]